MNPNYNKFDRFAYGNHDRRKINIKNDSKSTCARRSDLFSQSQYHMLETDVNEKARKYFKHKPYCNDMR